MADSLNVRMPSSLAVLTISGDARLRNDQLSDLSGRGHDFVDTAPAVIAGLAAMDATLSLPERQPADLLERRVETESIVLGRLDVLDTLGAKGADEALREHSDQRGRNEKWWGAQIQQSGDR